MSNSDDEDIVFDRRSKHVKEKSVKREYESVSINCISLRVYLAFETMHAERLLGDPCMT